MLAPGAKACALNLPATAKPLVKRNRALAPVPSELRVVDDLLRPVPVGRAELDVLEMFLGPALDALLQAMKS
jgi:hypothetical protein